MRRFGLLCLFAFLSGCAHPPIPPGEGYKGLPWGLDFKIFSANKSTEFQEKDHVCLAYFPQFIEAGNSQRDNAISAESGGWLLEGVIRGTSNNPIALGDRSDEKKYDTNLTSVVYDHTRTVYLIKEGTFFCFFDDKLFAAISPLSADSYDDVKKELDQKYKGTDLKTVSAVDVDKSTFRVREYSKPKDTRIYLFHVVQTNYPDETLTPKLDFYGLIYACDSCLKSITGVYHNYQKTPTPAPHNDHVE